MALTRDILRTWRGPRVVMRDLLAVGPREDRALAYLMSACFVIFLAQWPRLSREAFLGGQELSQRISYEFVSWLIVWPLVFYVLALIIHTVLLVFRARGSWFGARLALFWALLASSPLMLLYGLMAGFAGPTPGTDLIGGLWLVALAWFVVQCLREAEFGGSKPNV